MLSPSLANQAMNKQHPQASRSEDVIVTRYAIVIEQAGTNFSAYVPDLREDGTYTPPPSSRVDYVDIAA
jgi:hypothetical protein